MAVKLEVKLLKEETEKTAHNVFFIETNNRGTWERTRQAPVTSDDPAAEITLTIHERLVIEGHADYEVVYNAEQATTSIVQKSHEEPPPPPEPEPEPEPEPDPESGTRTKSSMAPPPKPYAPARPTSPLGRKP